MITGLIIALGGLVAVSAGFPGAVRHRGLSGTLFAMLLLAGVVMILCGVVLIAAPRFFTT